MPRQSGVVTARLEPQPSHVKLRSFAMFGKGVSSGKAITLNVTGSDRLQSRHSTKTPLTPMAYRRPIVGGLDGGDVMTISAEA